MAADGSIIIDTLIDTNGMDVGASNIKKTFTGLTGTIKKLGVAIGAAFAVKQIVSFGVESSKAARETADSMQGLQSILEGQGRSFSEAKSFIDEYVKDGLIPATNATTAYKNLALRGYDDTQIQQVLVALKDASAYGRQASYSMGEAVQSATEGLKNENSVLVDNAGVTKNVAKMWEDYAKSIGTTTNNLTQQQKIQAEVTGILEESKFQTGDAAKVAGTLSGRLQQLSFNFNNLKVAVGNIVNPFVKTFLPVINAAITAVTKFANRIAEVVNSFFGTSMNSFTDTATQISTGYDDSATNAENLASATNDVTDATKKATKAANKYLSPLDQINRYTKESADASTASTAPTTTGGITSTPSVDTGSLAKTGGVIAEVESKATAFFEKLKGYLAPLTEQLNRFGSIAKSAFTWLFENVLKPLGNFTINEVLPRFFQTLANVLEIVNNVLIALKPLWQWFWDNVLKPIATWTAEIFLSAWDAINEALGKFADWCAEHPKAIENATIVIGSFFAAFAIVEIVTKIMGIVNALASFVGTVKTLSTVVGAGTLASGLFGKAILALTSPAGIAVVAIGSIIAIGVLLWKNWDTIKEKASEIWGKIKDWLGRTWETIKKNASKFVEGIKNVFQKCWNAIKTVATTVWDGIKNTLSNIWNGIKNTASNIWNGITNTLSGAWEKIKTKASTLFDTIKTNINGAWTSIQKNASGAWDTISTKVGNVLTSISTKASEMGSTIKNAFVNAFTGIVNLIRTPVNAVIGFINGLISGVVGGINLILKAFNSLKISIPSWVPVYGGKTLGFNFQTLTAPKIPYLASGAVIPPNAPFMAVLGDQKNGTNIETPEALLRKIIREEMGNNNKTGNSKYQFTAQINRRTLFDEIITEATLRQSSSGKNPFELA